VKFSKSGLIFSGIYAIYFVGLYSVAFLYDDYGLTLLAVFPAVLLSLIVNAVAPWLLDPMVNLHCETSLCENFIGWGSLAAFALVSLLIAYLIGWAMQGFIFPTRVTLGLHQPGRPPPDSSLQD
jgi:hypothetical protein